MRSITEEAYSFLDRNYKAAFTADGLVRFMPIHHDGDEQIHQAELFNVIIKHLDETGLHHNELSKLLETRLEYQEYFVTKTNELFEEDIISKNELLMTLLNTAGVDEYECKAKIAKSAEEQYFLKHPEKIDIITKTIMDWAGQKLDFQLHFISNLTD